MVKFTHVAVVSVAVFTFVLLMTTVLALSGTVELLAPTNDTWITGTNDTIEFKFNMSTDDENASCELFINNTGYGVNATTYSNNITIMFANNSLSQDWFIWQVNCTEGTTVSSGEWYFGIDNTPPNLEWEQPVNNTYDNDYSPFITARLSDYLSGLDNSTVNDMKMEVNGTNYTLGTDLQLEPSWFADDYSYGYLSYHNSLETFSEGDVVDIRIYVYDNVGNVMSSFWNFTIDLTPPTLNLESSINETIGPNNPTLLSYNISDNYEVNSNYMLQFVDYNLMSGGQIIYNIYDETSNSSTPLSFFKENKTWDGTGFKVSNGSATTDNLVTVEEWYGQEYEVNGYLNEESVWVLFDKSTLDFSDIFDNTSPIGTSSVFKARNRNLTWDWENSSEIIINESTFSLTKENADDSHLFGVVFTGQDEAWNSNYSIINLTIDTTPPNITKSTPTNWSWINTPMTENVTFEYDVVENKIIKNCSLWTNQTGTWIRNTWNLTGVNLSDTNNFTLNFTNQGWYEWNVECYDTAENSMYGDDNRTWEFGLDRTIPNVTASAPGCSDETISSVKVSWTHGTDDLSGKYYKVYKNDLLAGGTEINYMVVIGLSDNRAYDFDIETWDLAGNLNTTENASVTCSTHEVTTGSPNPGNTNNDNSNPAPGAGGFRIDGDTAITIEKGKSGSMTFTVKNLNSFDMWFVGIGINDLDSAWYTLSKIAINKLDLISGKETTKLTINVPADAEAKEYPFFIKASGETGAGTEHTTSKKITLTVIEPIGPVVATVGTGTGAADTGDGGQEITGFVAFLAANPAPFLFAFVAIGFVLYAKFGRLIGSRTKKPYSGKKIFSKIKNSVVGGGSSYSYKGRGGDAIHKRVGRKIKSTVVGSGDYIYGGSKQDAIHRRVGKKIKEKIQTATQK